ncbi:MAG: hypothetical protein J6Q32_02285 [Clostridia bacterium]|nr:hypothetical protein [Clostridia bacterium]
MPTPLKIIQFKQTTDFVALIKDPSGTTHVGLCDSISRVVRTKFGRHLTGKRDGQSVGYANAA